MTEVTFSRSMISQMVCGVGGVEHEQRAHGDHAAQEALGEGQVVADGAHDQVDVLAVLVPRLGAVLDGAAQAVVSAGHDLGLPGGPAGRAHVGHLQGVRRSLGQAGQVLRRPLGLGDQPLQAPEARRVDLAPHGDDVLDAAGRPPRTSSTMGR